ncbi:MAG: hypothetical protein ACODAU_05980 [Myxococcota bacterium]
MIWRGISDGHRSTAGRLFVERMLTVVQTLRNQGRKVIGRPQVIRGRPSPVPDVRMM